MRRRFGFQELLTLCFMVLLFFPLVCQAQAIAIKAKKIYTVSSGIIENGVILIQDGKIQEVSTGLEIPWNVEVVDYSQKVIVPGMVEAHVARGYDVANETNPLTPFVTVLDNIDTSHDAFTAALKDGVTTLHIMPGNNTILGGQGAVVKTVGLVVEDMLLFPESGMKVSVVGTPAQTRMGVLAQLRRYFNETKEYMEKQKEESQKEEKMVSTPGSFRSPERVKYDSVMDLLEGRYKAYVYCQGPSDVVRAYNLSEKFGYRSVYLLGPECYKAVDFIAAKELDVILDPELVYYERDPLTKEVKKIDIVRVFHQKGIAFALISEPNRVHTRSLSYQAMKALSSGLSPDEALKAVTIIPARMLGVDDLVGSIDKGKLANFSVLDDDPFRLSTKVEFVYIDGKLVYERAKDEELKKLLEEKIIK
ncbi:MAG: amidohydrolase family protein [Candidatus Aminicenantaceae bacterium]